MTEAVLLKGGTLQKFIGDAVMAVWGDTHTLGYEEDAGLAVESALHMQESLAALNRDWSRNKDRIPFKIGVGLSFGDAIVGNIGHPKRMEFTVLGDTINLGARLEGATKAYRQDILVNEGVYSLTRDRFIYRRVDCLKVKGKELAVEIYSPLGNHEMGEPPWLKNYHEGIENYRQRLFPEAYACMKEAQSQQENGDYLCQLYMQRCKEYEQNPPPENWDGSYEMTQK